MAFSSKQCFFLILLLSLTMLSMAARPPRMTSSGSTLAARLQADDSYKCWESLIELRACTGEVILFFINGETYLGPNCCRAIRIIEHNCWPSMLGSLGFTQEEGDMLKDYCDSTDSHSTPHSPPSVMPSETISKSMVP